MRGIAYVFSLRKLKRLNTFVSAILYDQAIEKKYLMNLKDIHIGEQIHQKVEELQISIDRIISFMDCKGEDVERMYQQKSIETDYLLRWCKLLKYDFFRTYTGHLILYAPISKFPSSPKKGNKFPEFRKNIYTQEVKDFILEKVLSGQMTRPEVMEKYAIPKTTLYKWLKKI